MSTSSVHYSSASAVWLTPRVVIDHVCALTGGIDLDPCAEIPEPGAGYNVPATVHFTVREDGLRQPWVASMIYVNPPYSREVVHWVRKTLREYEAGRVGTALLLVAARPDTRWWRLLRDHSVCFVRGRLHFNGAGPAPFPSAIWYLGPDGAGFAAAFSDLGDTWQRVPVSD